MNLEEAYNLESYDDDDHRNLNCERLNYLSLMAQNLGISLDNVDIREKFLDQYNYVIDTNKINIVLFSLNHPEDAELSAEDAANLAAVLPSDVFKKKLMQEIATLQSKVSMTRETLAMNELRLEEKKRITVGDLAGPSLEQQVKEIIQDGFWDFTSACTNDKSFILTTKHPVILRREFDDTTRDLNLGKFELYIRPVAGSIQMFGVGAAGPRVDGYWHPHINSEGNPCWGNGGPAINEAVAKYDFVTVAKVAQMHVTESEGGTAYRPFEAFYWQQKASELVKAEQKIGFNLIDVSRWRKLFMYMEDPNVDYTRSTQVCIQHLYRHICRTDLASNNAHELHKLAVKMILENVSIQQPYEMVFKYFLEKNNYSYENVEPVDRIIRTRPEIPTGYWNEYYKQYLGKPPEGYNV